MFLALSYSHAIFIIDLFFTLFTSNHIICAYDSQIYHRCLPSEILYGIEFVQRDAQAVADWINKNELQRSLNMSKAMILGSEAYIISSEHNIHPLPPTLA